jgi:hypothetical protein
METAVRFVIMLGLLAAVLYGAVWIRNRKHKQQVSDPDDLKAISANPLSLWAMVIGLGGAIAAGFVMVTISFSDSPARTKNQGQQKLSAPEKLTPVFIDSGVPSAVTHRMKLIVFEDPDMVNPLTLDKCADSQVTVVNRRGQVSCEAYDDVTTNPEFTFEAYIPKDVHPQLQMMFAPGKASKPPKKRTRLWDRYAEIFYFLALVMGVLGKYYWDHNEARARGEQSQFHPNSIILSLIVALLVYFSVQQGIEGEGGKFSFRGFLFAFMNGFTWQTLIKPGGFMKPPKDGDAKPDGTPASN